MCVLLWLRWMNGTASVENRVPKRPLQDGRNGGSRVNENRSAPVLLWSRSIALALTDQQLAIVMPVATSIDSGRRDQFLRRVSAMMQFRPKTDQDLADVCALAAFGLAH